MKNIIFLLCLATAIASAEDFDTASMDVIWQCGRPAIVQLQYNDERRLLKVLKFSRDEETGVSWTLEGDDGDLVFYEKVTQRLRALKIPAGHVSPSKSGCADI